MEYTHSHYIAKKSFELSYALFRLAGVIKNRNYANAVEEKALRLLTSGAGEDFEAAIRDLRTVEYLVKFGTEFNFITPPNGEILLKEVVHLNSAIAESVHSAQLPEIDIKDVFSKQRPLVKEKDMKKGGGRKEEKVSTGEGKQEENGNPAMITPDPANIAAFSGIELSRYVKSVAVRQSAILDLIRQNNSCRLKDIQAQLPDISERTLRYDLQKLAEQGLIERAGGGGPATSYQLKEESNSDPIYLLQ